MADKDKQKDAKSLVRSVLRRGARGEPVAEDSHAVTPNSSDTPENAPAQRGIAASSGASEPDIGDARDAQDTPAANAGGAQLGESGESAAPPASSELGAARDASRGLSAADVFDAAAAAASDASLDAAETRSQPPADAPAAVDEEQEAVELIELYFELEQPDERDVVFERLRQIQLPLVDEFLATMMREDEDEYIQASAAAELAARGIPEGIARLEADLEEPEEVFFFEQAVRVLSELRGDAFYDTLAGIWQDAQREDELRREAMLAMEALAPERALQDFADFVAGLTDIQAMPDDQLEVAIMAFVRHEITAIIPELEGLRERIAASEVDAASKEELVELVDSGLTLLRTPSES